jgi:putative endonuclease
MLVSIRADEHRPTQPARNVGRVRVCVDLTQTLYRDHIHTGDMMAWMYILKCLDGSYYVGSTTNLELRVREHSDGIGSTYTAARRPVELVFTAEFASIAEAYEAEKRVQGWSRVKREALIRGDYAALPALARKKFSEYRKKRGKVRLD